MSAPSLGTATRKITDGQDVDALAVRVSASGAAIGAIFAAIMFIMVYQPGG